MSEPILPKMEAPPPPREASAGGSGRQWPPFLTWERMEQVMEEDRISRAVAEGREAWRRDELRRHRTVCGLLLLLIGSVLFDLGVTLRSEQDQELLQLDACGAPPPPLTVSRPGRAIPPPLKE